MSTRVANKSVANEVSRRQFLISSGVAVAAACIATPRLSAQQGLVEMAIIEGFFLPEPWSSTVDYRFRIEPSLLSNQLLEKHDSFPRVAASAHTFPVRARFTYSPTAPGQRSWSIPPRGLPTRRAPRCLAACRHFRLLIGVC
jgi:hypothetical protein